MWRPDGGSETTGTESRRAAAGGGDGRQEWGVATGVLQEESPLDGRAVVRSQDGGPGMSGTNVSFIQGSAKILSAKEGSSLCIC